MGPDKFTDGGADHWQFVEPDPDPEALLLAALEVAGLAASDEEAQAALAELLGTSGEEE
jgi:hypothetical protein